MVEVGRLDAENGGRPDVLAAIASGEVRLVVNTPSPEPPVVGDAARIRQAAIAEGILCFTTIETAIEAARSLDPTVVAACGDAQPLGEWQALGRRQSPSPVATRPMRHPRRCRAPSTKPGA